MCCAVYKVGLKPPNVVSGVMERKLNGCRRMHDGGFLKGGSCAQVGNKFKAITTSSWRFPELAVTSFLQ